MAQFPYTFETDSFYDEADYFERFEQSPKPMPCHLMKQSSINSMNFDPPSTLLPQACQDEQGPSEFFVEGETAGAMERKIQKSIQKKKPKTNKDYKKNICRNILRHAVKSMISNQICSEFVEELVSEPDQFKQHYNQILESITGFRALRAQLQQCENDDQFSRNRKEAFKQYLRWYLRTQSSAMILSGETLNPKEYLRYKNEVLLYYVNRPHEWKSNSPEWRTSTVTEQQFQSEYRPPHA